MPRYEHREGAVRRFWEIVLVGRTIFTRGGRLGGPGQTRARELPGPRTAAAAYREQIKRRVSEGFRLVDRSQPQLQPQPQAQPQARLPARSQPPVAAGTPAGSPELEAAVRAAPGDDAPRLVYGDWLAARGDPRGELVAVEHALARAPGDAALARRQALLWTEHEASLVGVLGHEPEAMALQWHLGFVRAARIDPAVCLQRRRDPAALLGALLHHPAARFLEDLAIESRPHADADAEAHADAAPAPDAVPAVPSALLDAAIDRLLDPDDATTLDGPPLRRLALGTRDTPWPTRWRDLGARFPALTALGLRARRDGPLPLAALDLAALESLDLAITGLVPADLAALARARLPRLARLGLDLRDAALDADTLSALADGRLLPALTHLGLWAAPDDTAHLVEALARSPRLGDGHLVELGLCLAPGAPAVSTLRRHHAALAHLRLVPAPDLPPTALYDFGLVARDVLGRPAEALAAFDAARDGLDDLADLWLERGNALDDLGRRADATSAWSRAARLDPEHAGAWFNLALAARRDARWDEARDHLDRACRIAPDDAQAIRLRGHARLMLGDAASGRADLERAIALYHRALGAHPDDAQAHFGLAAAHARLGQRGAVLRHLARAVALDPPLAGEILTDDDFRPFLDDPALRRILDGAPT